MEANEIVKKIRFNMPTEGFKYIHLDEGYMIDEIQKLLDEGIEVHVVKNPIVTHNEERILLRSFFVGEEGLLHEDNVKSAFIWCWYKIDWNKKELINIGFEYEKEKRIEL